MSSSPKAILPSKWQVTKLLRQIINERKSAFTVDYMPIHRRLIYVNAVRPETVPSYFSQ